LVDELVWSILQGEAEGVLTNETRNIVVAIAHIMAMTSPVGGYATSSLRVGGPFEIVSTASEGCPEILTSLSKLERPSGVFSMTDVRSLKLNSAVKQHEISSKDWREIGN
jgi:hypothetical protein